MMVYSSSPINRCFAYQTPIPLCLFYKTPIGEYIKNKRKHLIYQTFAYYYIKMLVFLAFLLRIVYKHLLVFPFMCCIPKMSLVTQSCQLFICIVVIVTIKVVITFFEIAQTVHLSLNLFTD